MEIKSSSDLREIFFQGVDRIWQSRTQNIKKEKDTPENRSAFFKNKYSKEDLARLRQIRKNLHNFPEFIKFHSEFILNIESNKYLLSIHIIKQNEDKIDSIKRNYQRRITPLFWRIYSTKKTKDEINRTIRIKVDTFLNNEILLLQTTNNLLLKHILKIDK
jgi:hypothetical protein